MGVLPFLLSPQLISKPLCIWRRCAGLHCEIKVRDCFFQLSHSFVDLAAQKVSYPLIKSPLDHDPHAPRGAFDDASGVFDVAGVEVWEFLLGDVGHLLLGQAETFVLASLFTFGRDDFLARFLGVGDFGGQLDSELPRAGI